MTSIRPPADFVFKGIPVTESKVGSLASHELSIGLRRRSGKSPTHLKDVGSVRGVSIRCSVQPGSLPLVRGICIVIIRTTEWTCGILIILVGDGVVSGTIVDSVGNTLFGSTKFPVSTNVNLVVFTIGWIGGTRRSRERTSTHVVQLSIWSHLHHSRHGGTQMVVLRIKTVRARHFEEEVDLLGVVNTLHLEIAMRILRTSHCTDER
mmetsp:Transcript_2745/g.6278  ORF Transcript_2745/g.6278 Transcript_2745/m.6278 type:complete len:207 (+) Transcript_2745:360-980(+)